MCPATAQCRGLESRPLARRNRTRSHQNTTKTCPGVPCEHLAIATRGADLATLESMRTISLLSAFAIIGCGGSTSSSEVTNELDAGTDSALPNVPDVVATQDAPPQLDMGTVPGRNPACPATVPAAGTRCDPILACDYASDTHHICTTHVDCASADRKTFKWVVSVPADDCGANSASCPASFTALADGSPCPGVSPSCTYPEGRCGCLPCSDEAGMSSEWACRKWGPSEMGCPADPPLSGDACPILDQQCSYGGFCGPRVGPSMRCEDGFWRQGGPTGSCRLLTCGSL